MYLAPPRIIDTGGVPVTAGATTILPALGATFFYRILWANLAIGRTNTGVVDLSLGDTGSITLLRGLGLSIAGQTVVIANYPEPGINLGVSEPLVLFCNSTTAVGNITATVCYRFGKIT